MPKAAAAPYIPLTCNICPKAPTFSDVSHLLTHVSSKSHLSCKFDISIRAQTNHEFHQQLASYEEWYETYGIGALLAERMASKEYKKNGGKRKKPPPAQPKRQNAERNNGGNINENINPALFDPQGSQAYRPPMPVMMQHPMHRHITQWATVDPSRGTPTPTPDWDHDSPPYTTPTMRNNVPNFGAFDAHGDSPVSGEFEDENSIGTHESHEEEKDTHRVAPSSQLKGVILPGMAIFDSATLEMQKRRNQKKDGSILQQMLFTSKHTPAVEVIFNQDFSFRRNREIFGEDGQSEDEEPVAPSPKRKTRGKAAIKKVDGNRKLQKIAARKPGLRRRTDFMNYDEDAEIGNLNHSFATALSTTGSTSSRNSVNNSRFDPNASEEEYLGYEAPRKKVKKAPAFRNQLDYTVENHESRSRTESPLEEHRYEGFPPQTPFYPLPPLPEQSKQALASPVPNAYHQTQANDKHPYNGAMEYGSNLPDNGNLDQLFVTEQVTPRQAAPYGLAVPQQFPPAYSQQQYFQENATINPLKAQGQARQVHQSHNGSYQSGQQGTSYTGNQGTAHFGHQGAPHSGNQGLSTYEGNFRPLDNNEFYFPPQQAHYGGGNDSGSFAKAEALTPNSTDQNPFF